MGPAEMYSAYKSVLILSLIIILLPSAVYADPLTSLRVKDGELNQYLVGEKIIVENQGIHESYIIDSINDGSLNLTKNIQNGFDMNVIQGTSSMYPLSGDWFGPGLVGYNWIGSQYSVGSEAYINDLNIALLNEANSRSSSFYSVYSFLSDGSFEIFIYSVNSALPIETLIKIYDDVSGSYVSRGTGLVLNTPPSYADVDIGINPILSLAFVVVVALASIFAVRKSMKLANKT